jgi:cytochrome c551/c552
MHRSALIALSITLALAGACKNDKKEDPTLTAAKALGTTVTPAAQTEANDIFTNRCTPCHGPMGGGDGPASANLTPKPRDFREKSWQTSVTDDHLAKIIKLGGAAVNKSAAMPANPDLTSDDKLPVVAALVGKVRTLGGN